VLNPRPCQERLLSEIFAPVSSSPQLEAWAVSKAGYGPSTRCLHRRWDAPWCVSRVFDRFTVWFPPPEIGPQLLYFLLQCHVERPLTTAARIVLPRVLQHKWSRPSRHVIEVGIYQRDQVPFAFRSLLTIPIVALLIPFHIRRLPDPRLDALPTTALRQFHQQQATLVRGVLDALDAYRPTILLPIL
jgi:hypothetical protein